MKNLFLSFSGEADMVIVHKDDTLQFSITCRDNALWVNQVSVLKHSENMEEDCSCTSISEQNGSQNQANFPCYVKDIETSLRPCSSCSLLIRKSDQNTNYAVSSADLIGFNDIEFNTRLCMFMEFSLRKAAHTNNVSLLHLALSNSPTTLQALKLGVANVTLSPQNLESLNVEYMERICELNEIDIKRLTFCERHFDGHLDSDDVFDMLLVDLVEPGGCMQQQVLEDIALAR